jgi:ABC-2 type transport system permease protein
MRALRSVAANEVRRQLLSPAAWLVVSVFALVSGAAFMFNLDAFLDVSLEALSAPPSRPVNVNQLLIRPFLVHVGLVALLVLPIITARALRNRLAPMSPASMPEVARVVGPFIGVMAVYTVMLVTSLVLVLGLFAFGAPEWRPIVSGYLGLLLIGAAFISAALFISSLATRVVPAAAATFAVSLALVACAWLARSAAPGARPAFQRFSIGETLDDFAKGVIDAGHIVMCLTIVAVALFFTRHTLEGDSSVETCADGASVETCADGAPVEMRADRTRDA